MSENLETISNQSVDSPSPRPLGTDKVEETYPNATESKHETVSQIPIVENDPAQVQHEPKQASEDDISSWKKDPYKTNPDMEQKNMWEQ